MSLSTTPNPPRPDPASPAQPGPGQFFEYFAAIEQRFNARRGSLLLLSTLDWALIETWREAGIPLGAVLRGIDASFDRYDLRATRAATARSRLGKVNGLAWCAQAVMKAAEQIVEASTGLPAGGRRAPHDPNSEGSGFESERVAAFLERSAEAIDAAGPPGRLATAESAPNAARDALVSTFSQTVVRLRELAASVRDPLMPSSSLSLPLPLEELDRTLTVLEERLLASLRAAASEQELAALGEAADRELGPARARLGALQSRRVREQFIAKRLLETWRLPRLSLFYMGVDE